MILSQLGHYHENSRRLGLGGRK